MKINTYFTLRGTFSTLLALGLLLNFKYGDVDAAELVEVTANSSTSLSVFWRNSSSDYNESAIEYLLLYGISDCSQQNATSESVIFTNLTINASAVTWINESFGKYVITSLEKWTWYQVKLKALSEDNTTLDDFSEVKCARTAQDAPTGSPRNFSVTNSSSTSLQLSWFPPLASRTHGFIRHYIIRYRNVSCNHSDIFELNSQWIFKEVDASLRNSTLNNLHYWTCYDVQIAAVTVAQGLFCSVSKVRTSEHAPKASPRNFSVTNSSSSSLQLSWSAPVASETNGFIRYYIIRHRNVSCNQSDQIEMNLEWQLTTVDASLRGSSLNDLKFWTCYDVKISAFTVAEGPPANFSRVRTSEHAPTGSPRNFSVTNSSSTSLQLSWAEPLPSKMHGFIRHYIIRYRNVSCNHSNTMEINGQWQSETVDATLRSSTLNGLHHWTCYDVQIAAVTVGPGLYANKSRARTSEHAPTAPPRNFSVTNSSSSSLLLTWREPQPAKTHGFIRYYIIRYRNVSCNHPNTMEINGQWVPKTVISSSRSLTLTNLTFWTCYDVQIAAVTVEEGPFANASGIRTSEHAPSASPRNFSVTNSSSTSFQLSWFPPLASRTHGFIRYYIIRYRNVSCNHSNTMEINGQWVSKTVVSSSRSLTLTNLTFWTCYDVQIAAVTVEEGPFASASKIRTSEHAPTAPPRNFTVNNSSSSSLKLSWSAPVASETHGFIRYYIIRYRNMSCSLSDQIDMNIEWRLKTVNAALRSASLDKLDVWTCYDVQISAFTVGEGPTANVSRIRTSEDAPTASPRNFSVTNSSSTSLLLSWLAPVASETHGFIRHYIIRYRNASCNHSNTSEENYQWVSSTVAASSHNSTLNGLQYWSCYDVQIAAVTVAVGLFANAPKIRTSEHAPTGSPRNFSVTNSSSDSLQLSWAEPLPSKTHGFIRHYIIRHRNVSCNHSNTMEIYGQWQSETVVASSRNLILTNLTFWSCYDVQIAAVTVGRGLFANKTRVRTSEHAPTAPPRNFSVTNSSSSSLKLSWSAPVASETHGFIRYYVIRYRNVNCSQSNQIDMNIKWQFTTVNAALRSASLNELKVWTCYDVQISAYTVGEGPTANVSRIRTSEDAPTAAPRDFKVRNQSSTSLALTWREPLQSERKGFIRYYLIKFNSVKCDKNDPAKLTPEVYNKTVRSSETSTILTGLSYWTCYEVKISAYTVGLGPYAAAEKIRTSEHPPTSPPENFFVKNYSSSSLELSWDQPIASKIHGLIRYYIIRYKVVNCSTKDPVISMPSWKIDTASAKKQSMKITNLAYWACYDVRISAVTVGEGPSANASSVRTSENAPTESPRSFSVTNYSSSSLQLNWTEPLPSKTHGFIRHYIIRYKNVSCEIGKVAATTSSWKFATVKEDRISIILTNLAYWTCYDVGISAVTVGEGPFANVSRTRTSEHAPTMPPMITSLRNTSSTSLLVQWEPPPQQFQHGRIRRYKVYYMETSCNGSATASPTVKPTTLLSSRGTTLGTTKTSTAKTEPTKEPSRQKRSILSSGSVSNGLMSTGDLPSTSSSTTLTGLQKWKCYLVYVICWTVGPSNSSNVRIARTAEDSPSKPRFASCSNQSATSIQLTWSDPVEHNGILLDYRLEWSNRARIISVNKRERIIQKLAIFSTYNFSIDARTSAGWGEKDMISCRTGDAPPSEPRDVTATPVSAWEIRISWKVPANLNGIFWYYRVEYNDKDGNRKVVNDIKDTKKVIEGLAPFTLYEFLVFCVGSGGTGQQAQVTATTQKSSPIPPTGTPATPATPSSPYTFEVRLRNFSNSNGPIQYYFVIVYDMKGGTPKDPDQYRSKDIVLYKDYKAGNMKPYVSGLLKKIPANGIFVVGDETTYSNSTRKRRDTSSVNGYVNGKLNPEASYMVFQRGFVTNNLYSSSKWYGPYKTGKVPPKPTDVAGIVAGVVVATLFVFVLAAGYYYYQRRRNNEKPAPPESIEIGGMGRGVDNEGITEEDAPVSVRDFEAYCERLNQNGGLKMSEQYNIIRNVPGDTNENSLHPINRDKNRYNNINAYDSTRVKLRSIDGVPQSDYINANYIDGYGKARAYIASQGPLPDTCEDFWRMVWEQDVSIIVMVTKCIENGRIKCHDYWPLSGSKTFSTMQISVSESTQLPNFNISLLSVLNSREPGQERFVRHFNFLTWPDHGTPPAAALLSFIRKVNEESPPEGGPIVVHCSAGVGRTGTYILMDVNLKRIAAEGKVDVFNFLQRIRRQRNYLVQTEKQYAFIHEALLEHIKLGKTEILAKDLRDHVKSLQSYTSNNELKLDREFQQLNEFAQNNEKYFKAAQLLCNKTKNRFFNILPFDDTRVHLTMSPGVQGSDYINANYVDGYQFANAFIATQAPLPNTVDDFWRMVSEQQSHTVVCLMKETDSARTRLHVYWPDEVLKSGSLLIEKLTENEQYDITVRDFKITNSQVGTSRVIRHFQYLSWPDNGMPENGAGILDLIGQVQKWQLQTGNRLVVVHCSTGVGRTGVFIAVSNLIERLKMEGLVNVFQVVRKLRGQRPAMVQTKGQYMFCYIALQDYLASFDIYSNFM